MACSESVIPEPELASGLELVEKKTVPFGGMIYYKCTEPDYITNDGFFYERKCMSNGQYNARDWLTCRERRLCIKPPPRPTVESGLAFSDSSLVLELDNAVYSCLLADHVVPDSVDGKFRTPCKRVGDFEQSVRIDWPKCVPKPDPATICSPLPELPEDSEIER